jgi:type II secretory pathway pseudopilin PulG
VQNPNPIQRLPKASEEGYLLVAVMFLLFLLALTLTVAAPRMARSIQRDRDVETMERGKQYIRGVQLYYRKFHAYPPSIDALVKTNEIRFLRKKYTDPITGKDDWKPIMFGQNKVPIAMGFFGQPLAGSSMAGVGPSGGNGLNGVNGASGINGSPTGGLFNSSGTGGSGSIFDSSNSSTNSSSSGSTDNSSGGSSSGSSTTNGTDSSGNSSSGTPGSGGSTTGTSTGFGSQTGQTFGGAGIIGFEPASSKQSILIWKKKDHYNEWEFTYDPIMDMRTMSGGNTGAIGQPASGMSSPIGSGTTTPSSSPFSTSPSTSNSTTGSSSSPQ